MAVAALTLVDCITVTSEALLLSEVVQKDRDILLCCYWAKINFLGKFNYRLGPVLTDSIRLAPWASQQRANRMIIMLKTLESAGAISYACHQSNQSTLAQVKSRSR